VVSEETTAGSNLLIAFSLDLPQLFTKTSHYADTLRILKAEHSAPEWLST
jgi:hypothetical protein